MQTNQSPEHLAILRRINVSRPQVEHPSSRRSEAAEEAYSRPVSGESAQRFPGTMDHSPTAPINPIPHDHIHPEIHPADRPGAETFLPSTLRVLDRLQDGAQEGEPAHLIPPISQEPQRRRKLISKPVSPKYSGARYTQLDLDFRAITPTDDGPYLRFAIDQLTRDEDVRGSRHYPINDRWTTRDQRQSEDRPDRALIGERDREDRSGLPYTYAEEGITPSPVEQPAVVQRAPAPAAQPIQRYSPETALPPAPNVFNRFENDSKYPLKFLPAILRPLWILVFAFLCLLMLVALIFSGAWSGTRVGLWAYSGFGGSRWFVFKYLPATCGMFLLLWLFQIQNAAQRVAPYIAMASSSAKSRSEAPLMEIQPTNFLLPKTFYFHAGQPIVGISMIIFWLQIFTVPLLAVVYNVYDYDGLVTGWRWTAVQGVVWTLVALYFLLIVATILLAGWLWRQRTGLKWDCRSLADVVTLLDRSNVIQHYDNTETFVTPKQFRDRLAYRSDTLGYWTASHKPDDVFYGIGDAGGDVRPANSTSGMFREKQSMETDRNRFAYDAQEPERAVTDLENGDEFKDIRYRYLPWYLRTPFVLLWSILAISLYLAFLVVSYVNDAVLRGFKPLVKVAPTSAAFSASNFLYAFIPALIGQILFLCWLSIDYAFRRLEPYVAMSSSGTDGAHATDSLLLDYPYRLPFSVTLAAAAGRHFQVAWFSFFSLIAATLPILAGGCFFSQFYVATQETRVSVNATGYYALCVFLALYAVTLPLVLIGLRKRRLPHPVTTLAEQISWLYTSPILGERELRTPGGSKIEMNTRLLAANTDRERQLDGGHFWFGRFIGRDGRPHLGIERVGRVRRAPAGKVPMSERNLRTSDERNGPQLSAPVMGAPFGTPASLIPGPAPGMAAAHARVVSTHSTLDRSRPTYYDPYARPATTGPIGHPLPREVMVLP